MVALGSCFADRIGERLKRALFPAVVNPAGIAYNPSSLGESLSGTKQSRLFLHHGQWRSLHHHSRLAHSDPREARELISQAEGALQEGLQKAEVLLLTLGTAQVFELTNSQMIVANCHRLEPSLFRRRRLTIEESMGALQAPLHNWLAQSQKRRVLITVSPVRYAKEGLVESQRSKAILHLTCEALTQGESRIEYFPAYEIVTDELRDYRFFAEDMLHPSQQAVDYVWERFVDTYIVEQDLAVLKKIENFQKLLAHRPSSGSPTHKLAARGEQLLSEISSSHPHLELEPYKNKLKEWICISN